MTIRKNNYGFTLVELMVSLIAGAILLAPLYIITRGLSAQATQQKMKTEANQRARIGLNILINDLIRTGLYVSPNPAEDPRSSHYSPANQSRRSVIHGNYNNTNPWGSDAPPDMDWILISGGFLGGRSYPAVLSSSNTVLIIPDTANGISASECLRLFDGQYSSVHLVSLSGKTHDGRIDIGGAAPVAGGGCTIQLSETIPQIVSADFAIGDRLFAGASQTALYLVEQVDEDAAGILETHKDLVRYFLRYNDDMPSDPCDITNGNLVSRRVIARYVEDFQVKFRTVVGTDNSGDGLSSSYFTLQNLIDNNYEFGGEPAKGTVNPGPGVSHIHSISDNIDDVVDDDAVGCQPNIISSQHVRSASIRLAVRSEKPNHSIDYNNFFTTDPSRLVRYSLRNADYKQSDGNTVNTPWAYEVKTYNTEVYMPNLASRPDLAGWNQ